MRVDLLKHNQEAYEKVKEILKTNNKTCVIQPTGSGKTHLALKLIEDYVEQDGDIIIIEPQKYIFEQLQKKMEKYELPSDNVKFLTYSALGKLNDEKIQKFNSPKLVFVDEMHRAGAPIWSSGIQKMFDAFPENCRYIGFSATPIRYLDKRRNIAEELFDGSIASEIGLADAILNRTLPLPRYIAGLYSYSSEVSAINKKIMQSYNSEEEKEKLLEEVKVLKSSLDKSNGISDIFKKYIECDKGKFVAFCRNVNHLRQMKSCLEKWFAEAEIDVNLYEVYCKNPEKDKQFTAFMEDDGLSVCLSIGMLSEGVHGIDGVILLRDTISPNLYYQQIGRCFSVDMKTVPIIFDLVANCESIMDCSLKNDLFDAIEKRDSEGIKKDNEVENDKETEGNSDNKKITKDDIEKFFLFDHVVDSVRTFREIENRLKDSWDLYVRALTEFKEKNGSCLVPYKYVHIFKDGTTLKLGIWVVDIRRRKKEKNRYLLSPEKINQLDKLGFVWNVDKSLFDKFFRHALLYKKKYGHVNIKKNDKIEGYDISSAYGNLFEVYKRGKLTKEQINKLKDIGIDIALGRHKRQYQTKMDLARQAVNEGVIITKNNKNFKGCNLHCFYIENKNKFTEEELEIMKRLMPNINKCTKKVAIINIKNGDVYTYTSITEAAKSLYNDFHMTKNEKSGKYIIGNRLSGRIKNPIYNDQFRFEYANSVD